MKRSLFAIILSILLLTSCITQAADPASLATLVQQGVDQTMAAASPTPTATLEPTATSTPTTTPIPPKPLAFTSNESGTWHIYTIKSDGTGQTRVSNNSMIEGTFDYSPDGQYIAFETYLDAEANSEIYRMKADGSEVSRLTTRAKNDWSPLWSPDGSRILFTSDLGNYNWEFFIMNSDGSGLVNLSNSSNFDTDAAWSPDGTRVAFKSGPWSGGEDMLLGKSSQTRIVIVDVPGLRKISLPLPDQYSNPSSPEWSPDGALLVFNCSTVLKTSKEDIIGSPHQGVCTANSDGSSVARIYEIPVTIDAYEVQYEPDPVFTPDGSRITFVGLTEANTTEIFSMNLDGSDIQQLTNSDLDTKTDIAWSPDGTLLLFNVQSGSLLSRKIDTYIMSADGSEIHQLLGTFKKNPWPIWLQ